MILESEVSEAGIMFAKFSDDIYLLNVMNPFNLLEGFFLGLCNLDRKLFVSWFIKILHSFYHNFISSHFIKASSTNLQKSPFSESRRPNWIHSEALQLVLVSHCSSNSLKRHRLLHFQFLICRLFCLLCRFLIPEYHLIRICFHKLLPFCQVFRHSCSLLSRDGLHKGQDVAAEKNPYQFLRRFFKVSFYRL